MPASIGWWRKLCYATLTLGRIFLRIWIFEIRGEFAQNLRIDSEYFHVRPRSPLDLSVPICYEFLRMLNNASQWLPMPYNSLRKLPTLTHALPTLLMATNAYENLRRMTVFATFAEIKKLFPMLFHTVANNIRVNLLTNENILQSLILRNIRRVFVSVRISQFTNRFVNFSECCEDGHSPRHSLALVSHC